MAYVNANVEIKFSETQKGESLLGGFTTAFAGSLPAYDAAKRVTIEPGKQVAIDLSSYKQVDVLGLRVEAGPGVRVRLRAPQRDSTDIVIRSFLVASLKSADQLVLINDNDKANVSVVVCVAGQ